MAKKQREEPSAPSQAWMNTFADLMNLLLCFFVLLFSMSTVDAQKFQLIAESFSETFSIFSAGATAVGDGIMISNGVSQLNELDRFMYSMGTSADAESNLPKSLEEMMEEMEKEQMKESEELAEKIEEALAENQLQDEVELEFTSQYVQLTLKGAVLFDSGRSELKEEVMPTIEKVAMILERYAGNLVEIEGHTDNVPIHTSQYESNDVLSSYRALSVFDYLVANTSLQPSQIKHAGRGEYVPIADNDTPEGRARNRRIEIKVYNSLSIQ